MKKLLYSLLFIGITILCVCVSIGILFHDGEDCSDEVSFSVKQGIPFSIPSVRAKRDENSCVPVNETVNFCWQEGDIVSWIRGQTKNTGDLHLYTWNRTSDSIVSHKCLSEVLSYVAFIGKGVAVSYEERSGSDSLVEYYDWTISGPERKWQKKIPGASIVNWNRRASKSNYLFVASEKQLLALNVLNGECAFKEQIPKEENSVVTADAFLDWIGIVTAPCTKLGEYNRMYPEKFKAIIRNRANATNARYEWKFTGRLRFVPPYVLVEKHNSKTEVFKFDQKFTKVGKINESIKMAMPLQDAFLWLSLLEEEDPIHADIRSLKDFKVGTWPDGGEREYHLTESSMAISRKNVLTSKGDSFFSYTGKSEAKLVKKIPQGEDVCFNSAFTGSSLFRVFLDPSIRHLEHFSLQVSEYTFSMNGDPLFFLIRSSSFDSIFFWDNPVCFPRNTDLSK